MNKLIICYGTRPELIKVAPIIWEFENNNLKDSLIIVNTNQHKETLFEKDLNIIPDYTLDTFARNQSIVLLNAKISTQFNELIKKLKINDNIIGVIAQGDTITTLSIAQTSFFNLIPFYHIEAGLRSNSIHNPFPEEFNRRSISLCTHHHFVPSKIEENNLINEQIDKTKITVSGNTVNDCLKHFFKDRPNDEKRNVLITIHRKENQNGNFDSIRRQIIDLAKKQKTFNFIWISHPNPNIQTKINNLRNTTSNLRIIEPVGYKEMLELYKKSKIIISDSGGIMEESAFLGIPRIIVRSDIERLSLLNLNDTFTFNPKKDDLITLFNSANITPSKPNYCYGKGNAGKLICAVLFKKLKKGS